MGFTESLIAIIDKISSQVGIVIDWTSENVLPYVMDLSTRIVKYEGAKSALAIVACIIILFVLLFLWKKTNTWFPKYESGYYAGSREEGFWLVRIFIGIGSVATSISMAFKVVFIAKCFIIPEMVILELLQKLSSGM